MCSTLTDSNLPGAITTSSRHNTQITNELKTECYTTSFILKRWSLKNQHSSDKGGSTACNQIWADLVISKVLRSLRHYLPAQSHKHHTIVSPKERSKEKVLKNQPKKTTRKSHHQSGSHWNCFKGSIRNTSEKQEGKNLSFPEHIYLLGVNWTGWTTNYPKTLLLWRKKIVFMTVLFLQRWCVATHVAG